MQKIIIFALTAIIILSTIVITSFAMKEVPYSYVLEFQENKKAYPIADSIDNAVPFFEYYQVNSNSHYIHFTKKYEDASMEFYAERDNVSITVEAHIVGSYPNFELDIVTPNDGTYTDFAIISNSSNDFSIIGFNNGIKTYIIENFNQHFIDATSGQYTFQEILFTEPTSGHYVNFPQTPEEAMHNSIIPTLISSLGSFVTGIGSAFPTAFKSVFITNGSLNALSIFLLVLFGCALAYGCIRWITGLFRKESKK